MSLTKQSLRDLEYRVIGAVMEVHKHTGPGLLEKVYQQFVAQEFTLRNIAFVREFPITIDYKGAVAKTDLRCDFVVEGVLPLELKAVEEFHPIHDAQTLTYMRLLQVPKGLLVNFNVAKIHPKGVRSLVNHLYYDLPEK